MRTLAWLGVHALALGVAGACALGCHGAGDRLQLAAQGDAGRRDAATTNDAGTCGADRCPITLARADAPGDLVLDDAHAYFTSCAGANGGGRVFSVALGGGDARMLASGPGCPITLALAGTNLYVAGLDGGKIERVPSAGGSTRVVASATGTADAIAVSDDSVYWTTSDGALLRATLDGGATEQLATCQTHCGRPLIAGTRVYWADTGAGAIRSMPLTGGAARLVCDGQDEIGDLAVAGAELYFGAGYVLMKAPLAGGAPVAVATAAGAPVYAVAADEANVYFSSYAAIWKVARTGGAPSAVTATTGEPRAVAVGDESLYWTAAPTAPHAQGGLFELTPK